MMMLIDTNKNSIVESTCCNGMFIGFMSATSPRNNNSSNMSDPSKSPSPMLACALKSERNSTARSGRVVPTPITVSAMKYAGRSK